MALVALGLPLTGCANNRDRTPCGVYDQTYVHKYGVQVPKQDWASRGKSGQVITTRADGVVVSNSYSEGVLHGRTTYTYPHTEVIQKIENYENGHLVSEKVMAYSGTPLREVRYTEGDDSEVTEWYENGAPKLREHWNGNFLETGQYFNTQHQIDSQVAGGEGNRFRRDAFGQMECEDEICQGQLVSSTYYYPNGTPKEKVPYQRHAVQGVKKTFHPGGEPATVEEWEAGTQHGATIVYQNGEKYAEVPYVRGAKHGVEKRFREGRIVAEEITWVNNERHGPHVSYLGEKPKTEWYHHGKHVSKAEWEIRNRKAPKEFLNEVGQGGEASTGA